MPFGLYNSPCTFYRSVASCMYFVKGQNWVLLNYTKTLKVFYLQQTPKRTPPPSPSQKVQSVVTTDLEQDEGPKADLDLCTGPKDAYVVEVKLMIGFDY